MRIEFLMCFGLFFTLKYIQMHKSRELLNNSKLSYHNQLNMFYKNILKILKIDNNYF